MKIQYNLLGIRFLLLGALLAMTCSLGFANQGDVAPQNTDNQAWLTQASHHKQDVQLRVDLFLSSTCPHCHAADKFFHHLEAKKPWISVHRYYINKDKTALDHLNQLVQAQKITINPFAVPAIFFCNSRWLGFDSAEGAGAELEKNLTYCRDQITKTGKLTPMTVNALRKNAVSDWYESNIVDNPSWSVLIPTLAGFEVLMTCSFFGFLVVFAFGYLISRRSLRVVLIGLFLSVIGLIHYLQQAHTGFFYEMLHQGQWPIAAVGVLLFGLIIFCYRDKGFFLQSHGSLKTIVAVGVAVLTVAGVYAYSQGCIPNYSLVFQRHVVIKAESTSQQFFYILLYQLMYLTYFALMLVIALAGCGRIRKYQAI